MSSTIPELAKPIQGMTDESYAAWQAVLAEFYDRNQQFVGNAGRPMLTGVRLPFTDVVVEMQPAVVGSDPFNSNYMSTNATVEECALIKCLGEKLGNPDVVGCIEGGSAYCIQQAIFAFRVKFFGKRVPDVGEAACFYSGDAHYSMKYGLDFLGLGNLVKEVPSKEDGSMDMANLQRQLSELDQGCKVLLFLTVGTTMKGAYDDVAGAVEALDNAGIREEDRYLHADGAFGLLLSKDLGAPSSINPGLGKGSPLSSGSISLYKAPGSPLVSAAFLVKQEFSPSRKAEAYVGSAGGGTKCGLSVLAGLAVIKYIPDEVRIAQAREDRRKAELLRDELVKGGVDARLNDYSIIVWFQLPLTTLPLPFAWMVVNDKRIAHYITLRHVSVDDVKLISRKTLDWFAKAKV